VLTKESPAPASIALKLKRLPPFPPVASKLVNLLARDGVSFREVANTLMTDAALSAEVLRLANSALASPRYPINSILEALAFAGTGRLAGLLMTLSLSKMLKRAGATATIRRSWRHSLACALAAREFASSLGRADDAYQAGLFHDLGRLALLVIDPAIYDEWLSQDVDLRALEKAHFGMDHCEAGGLLIEQWKLPKLFADAARHHHDPELDPTKMTMVVHTACVVANQLGFSVRPVEVTPEFSDKFGFSIAETINSLECEYGI
jgi:HD-like signal output (HDOD) protein